MAASKNLRRVEPQDAPPLASLSFGDLLRQHRVATGLTQQALAERAGLSVHGVQKLERSVTQPYRDTVQRLVVALRLSPDNQAELRAAAERAPRARPHRVLTAEDAARHNLPIAVTSFIGREQELDELRARLGATRVLTLTGVGDGCKTRLAVELARAVLDQYPDGVWLVELGPLADPDLVPQTVAAVMGVREATGQSVTSTLITAIRSRRLLLTINLGVWGFMHSACQPPVSRVCPACATHENTQSACSMR